jgi:hypothetical protein
VRTSRGSGGLVNHGLRDLPEVLIRLFGFCHATAKRRRSGGVKPKPAQIAKSFQNDPLPVF